MVVLTRGFEQAKMFIEGLFLSNKGVMEKLGSQIFFFDKYWGLNLK